MPRQGKSPDEVREPTTGVGLDTQQTSAATWSPC